MTQLAPFGELLGVVLPDVDVAGLSLDSRQVRPGDVFLALPGLASDGRAYIDAAVAAGARVVLAEAPCEQPVPDGVTLVAVTGLADRIGLLADRFYGQPSAGLQVACVTGTNGKTTVAWLLAAALAELGQRCGYAGTLGMGEPGNISATGMTSVDVVALHAWLAQLRAGGAACAAVEVSSHALDQRRIDHVQVDTAVFTNLSRDHLDYHGSMARYGQAKTRLFEQPGLRAAVINIDDTFGAQLAERLAGRAGLDLVTTSMRSRSAQLFADDVNQSAGLLAFNLHTGAVQQHFELPLQGRFNVHNVMGVTAVLQRWGHPMADIAAALVRAAFVPGRMQAFRADGRPLVVVDYAHTPDALQRALEAMCEVPRPPLVCVFGCGGDRDKGKRAEMGAIAESLADVVVLTDDNPRSENPEAIVTDIRSGMRKPEAALAVHDRRAAITTAINRAGAAGSVLVAGKGHERTQVYADRQLSFSDLDVVDELMRDAA